MWCPFLPFLLGNLSLLRHSLCVSLFFAEEAMIWPEWATCWFMCWLPKPVAGHMVSLLRLTNCIFHFVNITKEAHLAPYYATTAVLLQPPQTEGNFRGTVQCKYFPVTTEAVYDHHSLYKPVGLVACSQVNLLSCKFWIASAAPTWTLLLILQVDKYKRNLYHLYYFQWLRTVVLHECLHKLLMVALLC